MTATQAPTPGPLDSETVKLLVKGDLLRVLEVGPLLDDGDLRIGQIVAFRTLDFEGDPILEHESPSETLGWSSTRYSFIGRPDADGWMPWSGGENPVPGQRVDYRRRDLAHADGWRDYPSDTLRWAHGGYDTDIIAFRLAPTAPVEASGSEGMLWLEQALIEHLRSIGCKCPSPLIGYRPNSGPRCRLCNVEPEHLRPQPSGETRVGYDRSDVRYGLQLIADEECDEVAASYYAKKAIDLLSARPLALGGQHSGGEWRCEDCGAQADEWFDCCKNPARAEAQDEGAAGSDAVRHHAKTDADPVVSMLRDVAERLERPEPDLLGARVGVQAVRLAVSSRLLTHRSPTPAADADRVRIAVEALERIRGEAYAWTPSKAAHALGMIAHEAIAALKSEGK